jgi:hypothetical protein
VDIALPQRVPQEGSIKVTDCLHRKGSTSPELLANSISSPLSLPLILQRSILTTSSNMVIKKRSLLWDWTNTQKVPQQMDKVNLDGPISSVSNWNAWVPPELKSRAPFRPMIHLERELAGNEWNWILESKESIVHFFNEPERAGISVEQAAKYWKDQVSILLIPTLLINRNDAQHGLTHFISKGRSRASQRTAQRTRLAELRLRSRWH